MSNDEFRSPSSATGITWADLKGSLLLFKVHAVESGVSTVHGESDAVRADVIVLDGDAKGETYADALVFPRVLQAQIKSSVGGMVLGRLGQGEAKKGQSAPWLLAESAEADKAIARAYLAETAKPPF